MFRWLLFALLFAACQGGPTAADVSADRDFWNASRAFAALPTPSEADRANYAAVLAAVDARLTADERALAQEQSPSAQWAQLFALYGDALLTLEAGPFIQKRDPAVFRVLDANGDGALTLAELRALDPTKPANVPIVTALVIHMLSKHR